MCCFMEGLKMNFALSPHHSYIADSLSHFRWMYSYFFSLENAFNSYASSYWQLAGAVSPFLIVIHSVVMRSARQE